MHIEIKGLTEKQVEVLTEQLEAGGFDYDVDYTTLYGEGWAIVGLSVSDVRANAVVAQALLGMRIER
ncbi:MAG: hypothetical protein WD801_11515 [Gemmatimonadaceae bacterium]